MRYLARINPLPQRAAQTLAYYQRVLDQRIANMAPGRERTKIIDDLWKQKRRSKTLEVVEVALKAMASGLERCMYCDEGHGHQIEHFRPKASYDKETFEWGNLLWVCGECNNQKNADFDDQILNPTVDDPLAYLSLTSDGSFDAEPNSRGALTLRHIARLRAQKLVDGRKVALDHIKLILTEHFPVAGDESRMRIRHYVIMSPFGCVFAALLRASREPNAVDVLGAPLVGVLGRHPEIYNWLEDADRERRERARVDMVKLALEIGVGPTEDEVGEKP